MVRVGDEERMLATNFLAPFSLTRDLVPFLKQGMLPKVINIGSMFVNILSIVYDNAVVPDNIYRASVINCINKY